MSRHQYNGEQDWYTGDPITQERMNSIEGGIAQAHEKFVDIDELDIRLDKIDGGAALTDSLTLKTQVDQAKSRAEFAVSQAETALQETTSGREAWAQIQGALDRGYDDQGIPIDPYPNLDTRLDTELNIINDNFSAVNGNISSTQSNLALIEDEISRARSTLKFNGGNRSAENLREKMDDLDFQVSANKGSISSTRTDYNNALIAANHTYNSLKERLDTADEAVAAIQEEIEGVLDGNSYENITDRFEADELAISNLQTGKLNADSTGIVNNLNETYTNRALSANMGNTIKNMFGTGVGTEQGTTVVDLINAAQTSANNHTDSLLGQGFDSVHTVAASLDNTANSITGLNGRVSALETEIDMTSANSRIDLVETEMQNARTSSIIRTPGANDGDPDSDTTYGSLDARLEAIESHAADTRTDIDTIASELSMYNTQTGAIEVTNSRVSTIEENVVAMAKEIGMLQDDAAVMDLSTAVSRANTRVDQIVYDISHTATQGDNTTGLTQRIGALESDLNTATTGIKDRLDAIDDASTGSLAGLDSRLDTVENAISHIKDENDDNDKGGLEQRMDAVEILASTAKNTADAAATSAELSTLQTQVNGISTTIVLAKTEVNFDTDGMTPTTLKSGNIVDNNDYLIQSSVDDKYYYWKHINNAWHLMGGAGTGSGGNGNTSGYDLTSEEYEELEEYAVNTDYYVLESDGLRHHYRYIPNTLDDTILDEIEIGQIIDTNKIKRYNISTSEGTVDGEDVTYLNLYQYDYDELNNNVDTEREPLTRIILPKGGEGGASSTSINKLIRIGDQTIQKIVGSQVLLRVFYSSWDSSGMESSSGTYILKAGNTTIDTGTFNSGAADADLTQGWKDNTVGYYQFDVTDYCAVGNTAFTLAVTVNNTTLGKSWTANIVDLHLESTAPDVLLINSNESYNFPYTPFGALSKTLHVVIDDDTEHEITAELSSVTSGRATQITIPAQNHGAHKVELYLEATIGGVLQQTESIIREYIWYDTEDDTTILASPKNGLTITAQQYSTIEIPYQVYKKDTNIITLEYYLDNAVTPFDTITLEDTNTGILSYLASTQGTHTVTIKIENEANISISVNLNITELNIDVSPISGAIIDFDPTMLSNSSTNRLPSWTVGNNTYELTASNNFNWSEDASGGGYKTEPDGKCFVIKAGTYVDLNYPMFAGNSSNNIFTNGAEMKIIFKTEAVRDINAVWFQNVGTLTEKTVGIQLGAHFGWLKTDKATDTTTTSAGSEYDAWVSGTNYPLDSIVLYKDVIYKCIKICADYTDIVPGTSAADSYWTLLTGDNIPSDTTGIEVWATGTEYAKDTIISYNSAYYKCKKDVINEITTDPKTASSNWLSMGKIDTEVLATNSYLYFPYSEEDKIELDININKYNANADTNFIMSYEDGVPSKAYAYEYGAAGDGLYHSNTIRIGSNDCDVYIYRLRIYNKSLDTDDILQNFIADGNGINEKVSRYNRNCIYWDSTQEKFFTSPSATAVLDPIKLAERMPDVKILMLDTPTFTTGKKNFVYGSNLRCLQADGGIIYPSRGDADNWFFINGFHAGQGTTSDNYGQSARNVDFLFEVDGVNYPTKKKNMGSYTPSSEYVSSVLIGKTASTWNGTTWEPAREATEIETCDDWKGDKCKISLTESSVPNNYFNLKVNVASSENVNNALFQKRYDDFLTYNSPAQTAQIAKHRAGYTALGMNPNKIKVKNDMEFIPAVLFVRENDTTQDGNGNYTKHNEFNDTNWHFYALGNIGDSKKTDYTRAYNPDDMNEFTCENSDNNTNNGQFQSGVFTYQNHRAIETPYEAYDSEKIYKDGDIVVNNGVIQVYDGNTWSNATITGWTDETTPYFAPFTAPNPMEYVYPITPSEWNIKIGNEYVNYKHNTLVNEEFDGDHSFEFRYACRGDYRDGDLINESAGQDDDAQFNLNHDVMLAFYEWLITSTEEQYAAEAPQWFVKSAMEFFYAFTHYYTMMDNRAKNTFWHFAQTGEYRQVSRPVPELLHVYSVAEGNVTVDSNGVCTGTFSPTADTEINLEHVYYTNYAFDLWAYDCDTAAGIDNNGALVFPYGKEDTDYRTEGDPLSGYAFNGAGSIFWRRLRTTFASEIIDTMSSADVNCFNSQDLIDQFDEFQNCFPEEIWRLDIERKYIRTFTGESIDNSITTGKQNPRFLTSMMQGRKKYQRRQWIRDQGVYFNSKYRLADITSNSNTIEFNCTTPANIENIALAPSYYLQLTPYQDMYLNVQVGNGNYKDSYITPDGSKNLRAKAGQTYTFNLSGNYQETRIYINGANHLSAIGNLAAMYPYSFDLRALAHIKTLDIGTDVAEYVNTKFTELKLPTYMPLLESLNIKNCHSVAGTIGLSTANNIRSVEATGTAITGVSLPEYTNLQSLHVPSTVTSLSLHGARNLTDFKVYDSNEALSYGSLYKLHLYDSDYSSNVDWMEIATEMLQKESLETEISFLKMNVATIGDIQEMGPFMDFKEELEDAGGILDFTGTIHVTGDYSTVEKNTYETVWDGLTLDVSGATLVPKHKVTYKYSDYVDDETGTIIQGDVIKTIYIVDRAPVEDIYYTGKIDMPSRTPTVRYDYQFGLRTFGSYIENSGWQLSSTTNNENQPFSATSVPQVNSDMTVYTYFKADTRRYQVKWFMKRNNPNSLVKTSSGYIEYGGGADLEAPTVAEIHAAGIETAEVSFSGDVVTYSIFTGWEKLPINISPAATDTYYSIYANWETHTETLGNLFLDTTNLSPEQLLVLSRMNTTQRANYAPVSKVDVGQRITYTMGNDSIETPTATLVDTSNIKRFDIDAQPIKTAIQPLKNGADEFTIMIDYCFNPNATYSSDKKAAILLSCYYQTANKSTVTGFALYNNLNSNVGSTGPRVGFGDMFSNSAYSVSVGGNANLGARNVVVLRHPAGSSILYVYSGLSESNSLGSAVNVQQITWNNSTTDAYLNLGQLTDDTSMTYSTLSTVKGAGTVYEVKYWDKDLGVGECKRLASWPHETMVYAISGLNTSATSGSPAQDGTSNPSIGLTTLTVSSHGRIVQDTNASGWGNSTYSTIYNNHVVQGLPIKLQSILSKPYVKYLTVEIATVNGMDVATLSQNPSFQSNYLYMPSAADMDANVNSTYSQETVGVNYETSPFDWVDDANITIYDYNPNASQGGSWNIVTDSNASRYLNIRFPVRPFSPQIRLFRETSNSFSSTGGTTIQTEIQKKVPSLQSGDMFITNTNNTYMYVTNNDVLQLGLQVEPNSGIFATSDGGWISAKEYWLRSMMTPDTMYGAMAAYRTSFVNSSGIVTTVYNSNNAASSSGLYVNYSMAI